MSASNAFCALGTLFQFESAPDVFTTIAEVTNIQRSGAKRDTDESTHMQSPNNYKEFIPTLKDGGEWQVDVNFIPGDNLGQGVIASLFESGELTNFKVVLPHSLGDSTFAGIVTEYGNRQLPTDKKATDSFKLKVSGPVTDTFAS